MSIETGEDQSFQSPKSSAKVIALTSDLLKKCIRTALLAGVERYETAHKNAKGIFHGGAETIKKCQELRVLAGNKLELSAQLSELIAYLESRKNANTLRNESLMMCVMNALKSSAMEQGLDVFSETCVVDNAAAASSSSLENNTALFKGFYATFQPNSQANHLFFSATTTCQYRQSSSGF